MTWQDICPISIGMILGAGIMGICLSWDKVEAYVDNYIATHGEEVTEDDLKNILSQNVKKPVEG